MNRIKNKAIVISLYRARAIVSVAIVRLTINVVKTDLLIVTGEKKYIKKSVFNFVWIIRTNTNVFEQKKKKGGKKNKIKEKIME